MISTKKYKGILNRKGVKYSSYVQNYYTVIQVDNEIIRRVQTTNEIDSYFDLGENLEIIVIRIPMSVRFKLVLHLRTERIHLKYGLGKILTFWIGLGAIWYVIGWVLFGGDNYNIVFSIIAGIELFRSLFVLYKPDW